MNILFMGFLFWLLSRCNYLKRQQRESKERLTLQQQQLHKLQAVTQALQQQCSQLQQHNEKLLETQQQQRQAMEQLQQKTTVLEQQLANDKYYRRALKLAEKGADVEEIMQECELPRAEAEMMVAIHRHQAS